MDQGLSVKRIFAILVIASLTAALALRVDDDAKSGPDQALTPDRDALALVRPASGESSEPVVLAARWITGSASIQEPADASAAPEGTQDAPQTPAESGDSLAQFDPQELFTDWPDPTAVLFITGRQHGYIEPCGCTGLENAKGGLIRRHAAQTMVRQRGWPMVSIDAGDQTSRYGVQSVIKLSKTYEALVRIMQYDAIGFGPEDLIHPSIDLMQPLITYRQLKEQNPFVSANVSVFGEELTSRFVVVTAGTKKIGITAVLGDELAKEIHDRDITVTSAKEGLDKVWPELEQAACDYYVLIAHTSLEDSRHLAEQFPHFDVLITAGGEGEPTLFPEKIETGNHVTAMIQCGAKGMYVGVLGFYDDAQTPMRYQRIPLDARFRDNDVPSSGPSTADLTDMQKLFLSYQQQLQTLGLENLGLKPVGHPTGYQFVGSDACADCHTTAYEIWKEGVDGEGGPHYPATTDLIEPGQRTWVPRHYDPECLSCHVTGWNPQGYFPYFTGYLSQQDTHVYSNGCENCHGPGSQHVAAENGDFPASEEELEKLRHEMIITLEQARDSKCVECHDLDNSPDFHVEGAFEEYWERVKHYGKD